MTFRRTAILMTVVLTILICTGYHPAEVYAGTEESEPLQSSFQYKKYEEHADYLDALKRKMAGVYDNFESSLLDNRTLPIPGLITTCVLSEEEVTESKQYVPQGLCRAGDYMLITAYDVKKKNNTVIYAVDFNTNELVSTLTLPNKFHAGGIAFDGENIWMTGETSDKYKGDPFVQYITYERFLELIEEPLCEVSEEDISDYIYIKNKPSFLECNDGVLWVGTYIGRKSTAESYMYGYRITGEPGDRKLNMVMYSVIAGIDSSAQGADISGSFLYVSSSYNGFISGVKSSFVTKYYLGTADEIKSGADINVTGQEISRIEVPKMNEEILVDGATVYINFESGAERWKRAVINTDRIVALKSSLWR